MEREHEHQWTYDYKSCCYVLRCAICHKNTKAYHYAGDVPLKFGMPVKLIGDSFGPIGYKLNK